MRNWFWIAISAALWAGAARGAPPERVELASEIARNGTTIAEVSYLLEHDGHSYQITETSKGRGILALRGTIRRSSRGKVSPEGLRPEEFLDERTARPTARALFDWGSKTLTQQYKGEARVEPLPPHAHDRLAFIFDFAFAPPSRGKATFVLANGRGTSHHVYVPGGRGRLRTPLGEFDALSYVRVHEGERTEIWLAPDMSFLPLRVLVVEQDGTRYEQVMTRIAPQP
jgi:hypothetical protein